MKFIWVIVLLLTTVCFAVVKPPPPLVSSKRVSATPIVTQPSDITGLVAWYKSATVSGSDGDNINSWTDSSGGGHTMTATGNGPLFTNSLAGINSKKSLWFDQSIPVAPMTTANEAALMVTNIGIGMLVRCLSVSSGYLIGKEDTAIFYFGYALRFDGANQLTFYITPADNGTYYSISDTSFAADNWIYIYAEFNGTASALYTNNVLAASATPFSQGMRTNSVGIGLSCKDDATTGTRNSFGTPDVFIFNHALTTSERGELWTNYIKATYGL